MIRLLLHLTMLVALTLSVTVGVVETENILYEQNLNYLDQDDDKFIVFEDPADYILDSSFIQSLKAFSTVLILSAVLCLYSQSLFQLIRAPLRLLNSL